MAGRPRDTSELMWPAVAETLASLDPAGPDAASDAGARRLAQLYAQVIDSQDGHCRGCADPVACRRAETSAWAMRWLGPLLLDALEALGATPAARARLKGGGTPKNAPKSQLEQLREARARRRQ